MLQFSAIFIIEAFARSRKTPWTIYGVLLSSKTETFNYKKAKLVYIRIKTESGKTTLNYFINMEV